MENYIKYARPSSTFDNYDPKTETQQKALEVFRGLATLLSKNIKAIVNNPNPFPHAQMFFLSGPTGIGKTHLLEGLANRLIEANPKMRERLYWIRGQEFTGQFMGSSLMHYFDQTPIILVDDLFSTKQSLGELHERVEIDAMMRFASGVYERRALVVATSNFPFMQGIFAKVKSIDTIGRAASRLEEIMARSGEITMTGEDYRKTLAKDTGENPLDFLRQLGADRDPAQR